jgi:16S rRNA (guanine527-N7)-methyltransferase
MFNVKHPLDAVADWLGRDLDANQHRSLERFAAWLRDEAIDGGGIGPNEGTRIIERHLADSLAFLVGWDADPATLLDLGSGAGLPGIPLAISLPQTKVTLVDRSRRRAELASRAVRVLGLENVDVLVTDIASHRNHYTGAVMRAVLPPSRAVGTVARFIERGGAGVVGVGRDVAEGESTLDEALPEGYALERVEMNILDSPRTLLRITRT